MNIEHWISLALYHLQIALSCVLHTAHSHRALTRTFTNAVKDCRKVQCSAHKGHAAECHLLD